MKLESCPTVTKTAQIMQLQGTDETSWFTNIPERRDLVFSLVKRSSLGLIALVELVGDLSAGISDVHLAIPYVMGDGTILHAVRDSLLNEPEAFEELSGSAELDKELLQMNQELAFEIGLLYASQAVLVADRHGSDFHYPKGF